MAPAPLSAPATGTSPPSISGSPAGQPGLVAILWVLAGIVALGVVVVVGLVVLGGDAEEELEALGLPMENASEILDQAERRLNGQLEVALEAGGEVATDGDVSCWYSYPEGNESEPAEDLRCGPVVFADSAEDAFWLHVPVAFRAGEDSTRVALGTHMEPRTWALASGEELRRPDGKEAPSPDDIDLERPPPTTAEPGRTEEMDPTAVMVDLEQPEDGRLAGAGYALEVEGFTTTDRVRLGDERLGRPSVFAPAEGEHWLVFELSGQAYAGPSQADRFDYGLVVDGERRPLDLSDQVGLPDAERRTFAASVPEGADEIALVVNDGVARQRWSFATQHRMGDSPDVFYRDPETRVVAIDEERSLPYGVDNEFTPSPFGASELSLRFGEARLDYAVEIDYLDGNPSLHTASGPDRALLYLVDLSATWRGGLESEYGISPFDYVLSPDDAILTLEDGTEVRPTRLAADVFNLGTLTDLDVDGFDRGTMPIDIFGGFFVWDVPADIEHATLTIQPGTRVTSTTILEVDFQGGAVEVEIDFGS